MRNSPDRSKNDEEQIDLTNEPDVTYQSEEPATPPTKPEHGERATQTYPRKKPTRPPTSFHRNWILAVAVVALLSSVVLRNPPWNNLGGTLLVLVAGVGLLSSGWMQTRSSHTLTAAAVTFGIFLSLRSDPRLITLNLLTSITLLFLAAIYGRRTADCQDHDFWDFGPITLLSDLLEPIVRFSVGCEELVDEVRAQAADQKLGARNRHRIRSIAVGTAITIPILLILGSLLASADPIFASFFSFDLPNSSGLFIYPLLATLGAASMVLLLRTAAGRHPRPETKVPVFGWVEASVILVGLVTLFALFAFSQFLAISDTGDETLAEIGLRYRDYARQGFFQLLIVAALTLATITTLHTVTRTHLKEARLLRYLSAIAVGQTLFIVAVAYERLQRYVADDGLTPLRFYSLTFSLLIGAAFVATGIRVMGFRPEKKWLTPVFVVLSLATLAGLNLANPERIIAQHNIDRDELSILFHMEKQTDDGDAHTAANIDQLGQPLRSDVVNKLCERWAQPEDSGFFDWNYGSSQANTELERLCR